MTSVCCKLAKNKNEKNMKTITTLITLMLAGTLSTSAQIFRESATGVNPVIPEGWEFSIANGDLNKDGVLDMVVVTTPNYPEHMKTRDDGYVYNFNQPLLAIYFGESAGHYRLWKSYDDVVPYSDNEYLFIDFSHNITPRGTLQLSWSEMSSAGSWGNSSTTLTYRYQNGDFYLIGKDEQSMQRNTGEMEMVSENYLTHKQQRVTSNAFDDKVKPRERWSKLPKSALKRLGED